LLVVIAIIAILIGLLLPARTVEVNYSTTTSLSDAGDDFRPNSFQSTLYGNQALYGTTPALP